MSMLASRLAAAMKSAAAQMATDRDAGFVALAQAIITEIQAHAQVTVAVASVTGVTSGASASGPGTGTGTIT